MVQKDRNYYMYFIIAGLAFIYYQWKVEYPHLLHDDDELSKEFEERAKKSNLVKVKRSIEDGKSAKLHTLLVTVLCGVIVYTAHANATVAPDAPAPLKNQGVLALLIVLGSVSIYFLNSGYQAITKDINAANAPIAKDPHFWSENLMFAACLLVAYTVVGLKNGNAMSPISMFASFIFFVLFNAAFEYSGIMRWFYTNNPVDDIECEYNEATKTVDMSKCTVPKTADGKVALDSEQLHKYSKLGSAFGTVILAGIFFTGPVYRLITGELDFPSHGNWMNVTFDASVIALMALVATSVINLRRKQSFLPGHQAAITAFKFFLHHIVWHYTGVEHIISSALAAYGVKM